MRGAQFLAPLGVAVLMGTAVVLASTWLDLDAVSVGVLTGVGAAALAVALWRGRPVEEWSFVSLGAVFCMYYSISYGFALLGSAPDFSQRIFPRGLDEVALVSLPLGMIAWFMGYRLLHASAVSGALRRYLLPQRTIGPVGPATLMAIYASTVLVRVLLIASGVGYGYLRNAGDAIVSASPGQQLAAELGSFGVIVLGVAVVASGHAAAHRDGYRRVYRWMLPFELILGVLVGQKSEFLIVVLMVVLALLAAGRLSSRKIVLTMAVALLLIFPLVEAYRDILRPESGRQLSATEAPGALLTAAGQTADAFGAGPLAYSRYAFDRTVGRFREADRAAVSIHTHEAGKPFSSPGEMGMRVLAGAVPRVLWPGKPLDLYALEVSREYYGLPRSVITATSLSPVGDAYRYGGLPMVAVALALLGGYVRLLDEALRAKYSVWLVPLLIASIPLLRSGDLAGLLVGTVRYFVIVGLLYRLLFIRGPNRTGGPHRQPFPEAADERVGVPDD